VNLRRDDGSSEADLLNVTPELLREFLAHLSKPDDETVTLYADGRAVEITLLFLAEWLGFDILFREGFRFRRGCRTPKF
jgi:hypothetical protein